MGFHFYCNGKEYDFVSRWMGEDALQEHAKKLCEKYNLTHVIVRFGFSVWAYERGVIT